MSNESRETHSRTSQKREEQGQRYMEDQQDVLFCFVSGHACIVLHASLLWQNRKCATTLKCPARVPVTCLPCACSACESCNQEQAGSLGTKSRKNNVACSRNVCAGHCSVSCSDPLVFCCCCCCCSSCLACTICFSHADLLSKHPFHPCCHAMYM